MPFNGPVFAPMAWAALLLASVSSPLQAQPADAGAEQLVECRSNVSLDGRLLMQQWGAPSPDGCTQPLKTRVTDRFLGFTCVELGIEAATCRAFLPGADSRAYDTAKFFRCVDLGLTGWEDGITISRLREWASLKDECNWDPGAEVIAMEVDFDNGLVCAATLCMPAERLSVVGKLRLRQLLESAFRDLDLTAEAPSPRLIKPVHAGGR
jgi:hypothetical protein